ncbi:MAG: ArgE/DapE family deacylase [Candidatus Omnitrophica bacterium]|jgi:succinyl-diaminopimelate desuccinylase|nr:ArgE/DapE family deacylase [Candidatus Omnitrophota bacterium]
MKQSPINLLQKLIKIDSQNPPGNERKIIYFIRNYLKSLGIASKIYEFKKDRLNLVCKLTSKNPKKKILFTPHVDTVPANGKWHVPPLSAKIYKGRMYGRGATDCKINVAAALYLIKKLKEEKTTLKNIDLVFAFTGDEETGSHNGIIPLVKHLKGADYAIVLDADEFDIVVAQKGLLHLRVELTGREAHGAYPERGINAVEKGVFILNEILKRKFPFATHTLLKKPTLNIGRFVGGDKVNIVAGYAFFDIDIRYLPKMKEKEIIKNIEKIIKKQKIKYKIKILAHQSPLEIDKNIPVIKILRSVLKKNNIEGKIAPSFGATVITFLKDIGIESFAFGFGSKGNAHAKNESVKIANLDKGIKVLEEYVRGLDEYFRNR